MGVAVSDRIVSGAEKNSQDIVVTQFNSITLENSMKAALINPKPDVFNFKPADDFVAFGLQHQMFIVPIFTEGDGIKPFIRWGAISERFGTSL